MATGSLAGVMRRPTILLPVLAAAVLTTGCATFDNDTVASVGDVELSQDEFAQLIADQTPDPLAVPLRRRKLKTRPHPVDQGETNPGMGDRLDANDLFEVTEFGVLGA